MHLGTNRVITHCTIFLFLSPKLSSIAGRKSAILLLVLISSTTWTLFHVNTMPKVLNCLNPTTILGKFSVTFVHVVRDDTTISIGLGAILSISKIDGKSNKYTGTTFEFSVFFINCFSSYHIHFFLILLHHHLTRNDRSCCLLGWRSRWLRSNWRMSHRWVNRRSILGG